MARRTTWLVTVQKPRKNDGPYWMIRAKPPKGVTGAEGQPLRSPAPHREPMTERWRRRRPKRRLWS